MPELEALWWRLASDGGGLAESAAAARAAGGASVPGTLLSLGGRDSGIMFHAHQFALNALFAGHKRWFIYPGDALSGRFVDDQLRAAARRDATFVLDSVRAWVDHVYPLPTFTAAWRRVGFEVLQAAGDLLYVPAGLLHGTLNLDETLCLAVQGSRFLSVDDPRQPPHVRNAPAGDPRQTADESAGGEGIRAII